MTRRDQDESDDDFMLVRQQKRKKSLSLPKKNKELELHKESVGSVPNMAKTTARNEDIDDNDSDDPFISPSAPVFPDSESQCLDKSPIEEADEHISSADETIEIKHDDLEELEQQITFSSLNEWEVDMVNVSRKFKEYQRQLIASIRQKKRKLTWNNTFELLALSSIIVMCWPCPYSTFTSSEW